MSSAPSTSKGIFSEYINTTYFMVAICNFNSHIQIFSDPIPSGEIKCYIHALSSVRSLGKTNYFSCQLQTESSGVLRTVCFRKDRKDEMVILSVFHEGVQKLTSLSEDIISIS